MKILTIILILICGLSVFSQNQGQSTKNIKELKQQIKTFKYSNHYEFEFDKDKDKTNVRFAGFSLLGLAAQESVAGINGRIPSSGISDEFRLMMGTGFEFQGKELKESPSRYFIYFFLPGSAWALLEGVNLIVSTKDTVGNKEVIQFGKGEEKRLYGNYTSNPFLGFSATKSQLIKLSESKEATVKVGAVNYPLTAKHLQMFADIVKLSNLTPK